MRHATLQELGIRWYYWLMPFGFGAAGIMAFAGIKLEPEGRATLVACGILFCAISFLAFLWPVLRTREKQGVQYTSMSVPETYQGVFIPMSKVKIDLLVIGGIIFGMASLLAAIFADSLEIRVKAAIAFAGYIGLGFMWLRSSPKHKYGVLLSERGILWQELLLTPCFITWDNISAARTYAHPEKYGRTSLTFGLLVRDIRRLDLCSRARSKVMENAKKFGWHLYLHGESLLVPLGVLELATNFYLLHTESRQELATGAAVDRFTQLSRQVISP